MDKLVTSYENEVYEDAIDKTQLTVPRSID
jgi:hypothetical protein